MFPSVFGKRSDVRGEKVSDLLPYAGGMKNHLDVNHTDSYSTMHILLEPYPKQENQTTDITGDAAYKNGKRIKTGACLNKINIIFRYLKLSCRGSG